MTTTDLRLLAAFYKYPELFFHWRNQHCRYHLGQIGVAEYNNSYRAVAKAVGPALVPHLLAVEKAWDILAYEDDDAEEATYD